MNNKYGFPVPDWHAPEFPVAEVMTGRYCRLEPLNAVDHGPSLWRAHEYGQRPDLWDYMAPSMIKVFRSDG